MKPRGQDSCPWRSALQTPLALTLDREQSGRACTHVPAGHPPDFEAIERAARASLSNRHNSDDGNAGGSENEQSELPFQLSGSQAKTAHALRLNAEKLIRAEGLERIGFLTLTVGNKRGGRFAQVFDAEEASRRINNLNRRVLPSLFSRAIVVTERHQNGAIHFHIIGAMASGADIRTGFDFASFMAAREARDAGTPDKRAERRYRAAATSELRATWAFLRANLPRYGFGRAELTPVRKSGEAIASYVAKYVQKNLFNRFHRRTSVGSGEKKQAACHDPDYRKKLVRYVGWSGSHTRSNDFGWASRRAAAWRGNARELAGLAGAGHGNVSAAFGPRWAFHLTKIMNAVRGNDQNMIEWKTWPEREAARLLVWTASGDWARHLEEAHRWNPIRTHWLRTSTASERAQGVLL